jgi:hypothetical protein
VHLSDDDKRGKKNTLKMPKCIPQFLVFVSNRVPQVFFASYQSLFFRRDICHILYNNTSAIDQIEMTIALISMGNTSLGNWVK